MFAGVVCYRDRHSQPASWGHELWVTDGSPGGTRRVKRISSSSEGSSPSHFAEFNGLLFFQATSVESGTELWATDGTRQGTALVADIEIGSRSSAPEFLSVFGDRLVFSANTALYGREPWISDGTRRTDFTLSHAHVGTGILFDICAGAGSSDPKYFAELVNSAGKTLLLFQADDCVHGAELWVSDRTTLATELVVDINPGETGSYPSYLTLFSGRVYFQADDGVRGKELWSTDGTGTGTALLVDLAAGVASSTPSLLSVLAVNAGSSSSTLVFAAQAERDGKWEFWQSDGTLAVTRKLFVGSRETAAINVDAMDALLSPRFLAASPAARSFYYFGTNSNRRDWLPLERHASDDGIDTTTRTRSITLFDVESEQSGAEYAVSLSASNGLLTLGPTTCSHSDIDLGTPRQPSAAITLTASLQHLNCALERVTYHANANASGWESVNVTLVELGVSTVSRRAGGAAADGDDRRLYATSARIPINIRSVNDAPVIDMANAYFAPLDAWTELWDVKVSDADAGDGRLFLQLRVHNGLLRVRPDAASLSLRQSVDHLTISPSSESGASMLEFAATVADTSAVLQTLEYRCPTKLGCRDGMLDFLFVYVNDNGYSGDDGIPRDATSTAEIRVRAGG